MTKLPQILHLVDDATPGGVTRVLEHIRTCPMMADAGEHIVQTVSPRGRLPHCNADMIVSHLSMNWRRLPALITFRARHAGTPLVHVEHSYTEAFTILNVKSKLRFFTMLRTAYALFDTVVAVSAEQGAWLKRRRLVSEQTLRVIAPVVPLDQFRALKAPTGKPRVIGAIGRLHRQKGFDVLLQAFRSLPDRDIALHVYGVGPEEDALREIANGDPRICFYGYCDRPEIVMNAIDVVAMPSRWEAFGLVALEARAAGRGLVCTDMDGLSMSGGDDARFVRGHNIRDWTKVLQETLAQDVNAVAPDRVAGCEAAFAENWQGLIEHHLPQQSVRIRKTKNGAAGLAVVSAN